MTGNRDNGGGTKEGSVPRLIFWELTGACNLSCRHCRAASPTVWDTSGELTFTEVLRILEEIAELARPTLVLTGGEPLCREDLPEIVRQADARGLPVALATNGTLVERATARRLAACGLRRAAVSLDGAGAEFHDRFRGLPGSFAAALAGAHHFIAAGVPTQLNFTVTRDNRDQLDQMLELARRIGACAVHVFLLVPVGCGRQLAETQMLSGEQVEEALRWLYQEAKRGDLEIKPTCAPQYYRLARQHHQIDPITSGPNVTHHLGRGCLAGSGVCFISRTGQVQGCGYLPVAAGQLRQRRFADLWRDSPLLIQLRDPSRLEGKCGVCGYRQVCVGCRARAYTQSGNFLAEEPCCAYRPEEKKVGTEV